MDDITTTLEYLYFNAGVRNPYGYHLLVPEENRDREDVFLCLAFMEDNGWTYEFVEKTE